MDPTELFIEKTASIQIHCTEGIRNSFQNVAVGTKIYQIDNDAGEYTFNGTEWVRNVKPVEPELTVDDISNIKRIPELCTLNDVIQYITDNKDVFETIKSVIGKLESKPDKTEVYTKNEIDNKLLALSLKPANSLKTKDGAVSVWSSPSPSTNQVLTAINKETAIWTEPHMPISPLMYSKLISRVEELERYIRELEAKKKLKSSPTVNDQILFKWGGASTIL